jgi:hypothetical protein
MAIPSACFSPAVGSLVFRKINFMRSSKAVEWRPDIRRYEEASKRPNTPE